MPTVLSGSYLSAALGAGSGGNSGSGVGGSSGGRWTSMSRIGLIRATLYVSIVCTCSLYILIEKAARKWSMSLLYETEEELAAETQQQRRRRRPQTGGRALSSSLVFLVVDICNKFVVAAIARYGQKKIAWREKLLVCGPLDFVAIDLPENIGDMHFEKFDYVSIDLSWSAHPALEVATDNNTDRNCEGRNSTGFTAFVPQAGQCYYLVSCSSQQQQQQVEQSQLDTTLPRTPALMGTVESVPSTAHHSLFGDLSASDSLTGSASSSTSGSAQVNDGDLRQQSSTGSLSDGRHSADQSKGSVAAVGLERVLLQSSHRNRKSNDGGSSRGSLRATLMRYGPRKSAWNSRFISKVVSPAASSNESDVSEKPRSKAPSAEDIKAVAIVPHPSKLLGAENNGNTADGAGKPRMEKRQQNLSASMPQLPSRTELLKQEGSPSSLLPFSFNFPFSSSTSSSASAGTNDCQQQKARKRRMDNGTARFEVGECVDASGGRLGEHRLLNVGIFKFRQRISRTLLRTHGSIRRRSSHSRNRYVAGLKSPSMDNVAIGMCAALPNGAAAPLQQSSLPAPALTPSLTENTSVTEKQEKRSFEMAAVLDNGTDMKEQQKWEQVGAEFLAESRLLSESIDQLLTQRLQAIAIEDVGLGDTSAPKEEVVESSGCCSGEPLVPSSASSLSSSSSSSSSAASTLSSSSSTVTLSDSDSSVATDSSVSGTAAGKPQEKQGGTSVRALGCIQGLLLDALETPALDDSCRSGSANISNGCKDGSDTDADGVIYAADEDVLDYDDLLFLSQSRAAECNRNERDSDGYEQRRDEGIGALAGVLLDTTTSKSRGSSAAGAAVSAGAASSADGAEIRRWWPRRVLPVQNMQYMPKLSKAFSTQTLRPAAVSEGSAMYICDGCAHRGEFGDRSATAASSGLAGSRGRTNVLIDAADMAVATSTKTGGSDGCGCCSDERCYFSRRDACSKVLWLDNSMSYRSTSRDGENSGCNSTTSGKVDYWDILSRCPMRPTSSLALSSLKDMAESCSLGTQSNVLTRFDSFGAFTNEQRVQGEMKEADDDDGDDDGGDEDDSEDEDDGSHGVIASSRSKSSQSPYYSSNSFQRHGGCGSGGTMRGLSGQRNKPKQKRVLSEPMQYILYNSYLRYYGRPSEV
ncbi:hypothetical protein GQ54DRAFT_298570 [Martensiomyces pterosporus]|nr:hypothetical protein GQ54DRAFT_298570 [Martensiomyces pterosporus]